MTAPPMDPQYEQRLRDEVIYLHSLWHQGPPRAAASAVRHHLQPSKSTQFKKENTRRGKSGKKSTNKPNNTAPEYNSFPAAKWLCPTPPPPPPSSAEGWPNLEVKPHPKPLSLSLSLEEQSKLAAKQAHQHALKVVHEFFRSNNADDSDAIDSSSDEDDELMEEDDGREEYSFFFNVFKEDAELTEYYEKNFAKGEFSCLVCGAVGGKKTGKKFKSCLALVQHSITIAKTKKRRAHRAFGQAVCKVLGWDINQLPAIVSLLSDKSGETQGNGSSGQITFVDMVDSVEGKNDEAVPESGSIGAGILPSGDAGDMNSLTCPDAGQNLEDLGMVRPHNVEEPAAECLTSNSLMCPDVDKSLENLGMVHPHSVEESASEGLIINSLMCPNADKNLENPAVVYPHNLEEPTAEGLTNVPLNENNGAGNEMQDLKMGNGALNGLNEDNEIEN